MKKFVIAFMNFNTGELTQELVEAKTELDACISYLNWWDEDTEKPKDMDEIIDIVVNSDCDIHVLELKHERTGRPGGGLQNQIAGFDSRARVQ
jgi:hypothetical protein